MPNEDLLKRNLVLLGFMKIFTKRAFLPIVGIYFADYVKLSLPQMAFVATFVSIVGLIAQIPTGYFADRLSRLTSLRVGAIILAVGSTFYFTKPDFLGVMIASVMLQLGYSFIGGASQAHIHDTLVALNRENEYSKVMSRSQSYGLFGNFVIVTLTGLTYSIDPRLPFVIGSLAYAALMLVTLLMTNPGVSHRSKHSRGDYSVVLKPVVGLFLIVVGLIGAANSGPSHLYSLAQHDAGLSIALISILGGGTSLISGIFGFLNHHFERLHTAVFVSLDILMVALNFVSFATKNVPFVIVTNVASMYFFRYRMVIYEHKVLNVLKYSSLKATILSTIDAIVQLNETWVPFALTGLAMSSGIIYGFQRLGLILTATLIPLGIVSSILWSKYAAASVTSKAGL